MVPAADSSVCVLCVSFSVLFCREVHAPYHTRFVYPWTETINSANALLCSTQPQNACACAAMELNQGSHPFVRPLKLCHMHKTHTYNAIHETISYLYRYVLNYFEKNNGKENETKRLSFLKKYIFQMCTHSHLTLFDFVDENIICIYSNYSGNGSSSQGEHQMTIPTFHVRFSVPFRSLTNGKEQIYLYSWMGKRMQLNNVCLEYK